MIPALDRAAVHALLRDSGRGHVQAGRRAFRPAGLVLVRPMDPKPERGRSTRSRACPSQSVADPKKLLSKMNLTNLCICEENGAVAQWRGALA